VSRPLKGKINGADIIPPSVTKSSSSSSSSSTIHETNKVSFIQYFGQTLTAAVSTPRVVAPLSVSSLALSTAQVASGSEAIEAIDSNRSNSEEAIQQQAIPIPEKETPPFMLYRQLLLSTDTAVFVPTITTSNAATISSSSAVKVSKRASKTVVESATTSSKQGDVESKDIPWTDVEIAIMEKLTQYGNRINK